MPTKKTEEQTEQIVAEPKEEKKKGFYQRIAHVQAILKAPKSRYNKFGEYNYRSLEDIFEGVKSLCEENDLLLYLTDEPVICGDWHYIKATASIADSLNERYEPLSVTAYAREPLEKKKSDSSQITGATSSYARKYALNGLFLIDDTKDADTDEYTKQNVEAPQKITPTEAKALENMLSENQKNWVLTHCNVKSISELTQAQYMQVVNGLKRNESKNQSKDQ